ncbi:MAG TPA: hypothetical protein VFL80_02990 [Thermoanaerobaculia bacterium]|nr:hypothetical protein [Thermoanaerobaculia bacterium]
MRRWFILIAVLCAAGCSTAPDPAATTSTEAAGPARYSADTPHSVGAIPNAVLRDPSRNRDVEMVVEYPTKGGPYPVIIFSHGYGAARNTYVALTEYWTGHGFVCILPQHADAGLLRERLRQTTRERIEERREERRERRQTGQIRDPRDQPEEQGERRERVRQAAESFWQSQSENDWRNRVSDVTFVLDSLTQLEEQYPELRGKIDRTRVGVGGHSYGAYTAMLIAGATPFRDGNALRFGDSRVRAILAMSPQGTGVGGLTEQSWTGLRIPAMYMTGSLDQGLAEHPATWRRDPFTHGTGKDQYYVSITGARHGSFTGRFSEMMDRKPERFPQPVPGRDRRSFEPPADAGPPRGAAGPEGEQRIFNAVKAASTAFWQAYLRDDAKAKAFLATELEGLNRGGIEVGRR